MYTRLLTIAAIAFIPIVPARASDFKASVDGSGTCSTPGPAPAFGTWSNNTTGSGSSSAYATSEGGLLGATASANSTGVYSGFNTNAACYISEFVIDDVVITGPSSTVSVQVSAELDGFITLAGSNATDATANVKATLQMGEVTGSGILLHGGSLGQVNLGTFAAPFQAPVSASLSSKAVTLPTSSTLVVRMVLSGKVIASDNFSPGSASAAVDFSQGLSFPGSGPVFTLPAGFTVNSVDGHIVDNLFSTPKPDPSNYCTAGTSASGCNALLSASGTASESIPFGFTLSAAAVEGDKDGLFFFGANGRQANPWGSGTSYQCVATPVKRAGILLGTGTPGLCDGALSQDLNALWCPSCPGALKNPGAGAVVQAQLWYRDPLNTSNQTTSLSDAIEFPVCP